MAASQSSESAFPALEKSGGALEEPASLASHCSLVLEESWTLTAAAALVVLHNKIGPLTTGIAFLLFAALSVATVAVIFAYYAMHPDTADATLAELGARLRQAGPMLVVVISSVASVFLLVDGVINLQG